MAKKLSFFEVVCIALITNVINNYWQVTSSFTVGPQSSIGPDVCAGYSCPDDKYCVVNETNNRPECVCNEICSDLSDPVCGNDGLTYSNECYLVAFACVYNFEIRVVSHERCSDMPVDCSEVVCPGNDKVCVMNESQFPECVCNNICDDLFDPYCGSDGQTYSNACFINFAVCEFGISVQHQGSCNDGPTTPGPIDETTTTTGPDVCAGYSCPADKHCVVNETTNRPECVCNEICFLLFAPVCGSDGKDYGNQCFLKVAACKANMVITVQHQGSCNDGPITPGPIDETTTTTGSDICAGYSCPAGKHCVVNETTNRPECVCNEICFLLFAPVCGSDGKDYGNQCFLNVAACKANMVITVQHQGSCNDVPSPTVPIQTTVTEETGITGQGCAGFECPFNGKCVPDGYNRPKCVCVLACNKIYRPVCGSNNQTYGNDCELRRAACEAGTTITILRTGRCEDQVTATTPSAQTTTKHRRPWWPKCRKGKHGRRYNDNGV